METNNDSIVRRSGIGMSIVRNAEYWVKVNRILERVNTNTYRTLNQYANQFGNLSLRQVAKLICKYKFEDGEIYDTMNTTYDDPKICLNE